MFACLSVFLYCICVTCCLAGIINNDDDDNDGNRTYGARRPHVKFCPKSLVLKFVVNLLCNKFS